MSAEWSTVAGGAPPPAGMPRDGALVLVMAPRRRALRPLASLTIAAVVAATTRRRQAGRAVLSMWPVAK